jgi:hypothetical protein
MSEEGVEEGSKQEAESSKREAVSRRQKAVGCLV